jgi:hypothetical protein
MNVRLTGQRIPRVVDDGRPRPDARTETIYRKAVAHEMLQARENARARALDPAIDPNDSRWKLAIETQRALQGTVLAYEDRARLLALATRLGIGAFDANLIVAVVQDRARRGEPLADAAPTIALIPNGRPSGAQAAAGSVMDAAMASATISRTSATAVAPGTIPAPGRRTALRLTTSPTREGEAPSCAARPASHATEAGDVEAEATSSAWPWVTGMVVAIAIDAVLIGWLMFG